MVKVRNLARRPVTLACNSGEYRHIPALGSVEMSDIDIKGNAMLDKLVKRYVLALGEEGKAEAKKPSSAKARKGQHADTRRGSTTSRSGA